jgi:predicted dehydrogenase
MREAMRHPRAEIAALCDIDPEALKQASEICGPEPRPYADYQELLRRETLDGVVVAVPQYLHARLSIDALDAGCTTFCEKPMGLNVVECETMIAAARRNRKGLMIGQVLRYIGVYRYVLERAQSGDLGDPFAVRIIRSMGKWDRWLRPWRCKRETSGGLLLEVNAHEIDFMCCLLGEAASVTALGNRFVNEEVDYEDFVSAQILFKNGRIGSLTSAGTDYLGRYTGEVYLDNGTIYYDSLSQLVHVMRRGGEKEIIPYAEIHPEWENGVYREMREFIETCLEERPVTIPGEEGLRAVEIGEACYRSIREKRPVTLPLPRG